MSEASDCDGCCAAFTCEHIDATIKESTSFHSPDDTDDSCKPVDEMDEAPILSAGHTGHSLKSLPTGYTIHFLGLNQAQWSCLIMTYSTDLKSTYVGIHILDIYNQLQSSISHHNTKHAATIKAWSDKKI